MVSKADILGHLKDQQVQFLRLQFTDILGTNKAIELPTAQFEKALDGEVVFDGSAIEGFGRIDGEESDMLLRPDYATLLVYPTALEPAEGRIARLICDVTDPSGQPFAGDPRHVLKRQIARLQSKGFDNLIVGAEPEFFLFNRTPEGSPSTQTSDQAGYFDLVPTDRGETARRQMVAILTAMGFHIEAAHHEGAPGQHEIDFKHADALSTADNIMTFKSVAKRVAIAHGLHATFMPKPLVGVNGSGMHLHLSLLKNGQNAFFEPKGKAEVWPYQLSKTALHFVGGLLEHTEGMLAITNPLVNSYKRLIPGYEAPTNVAWSVSHRSAMVRIPTRRGVGTRAELRIPDPACNPYLALAVILAAGLDGLEGGYTPPPPIERNVTDLSIRDKRKYRVSELPETLHEALEGLRKNRVIREALGPHVYEHFTQAKELEWHAYRSAVHQWEIHQYLGE
jgi:glutamine synthetase